MRTEESGEKTPTGGSGLEATEHHYSFFTVICGGPSPVPSAFFVLLPTIQNDDHNDHGGGRKSTKQATNYRRDLVLPRVLVVFGRVRWTMISRASARV
jgi:hypothetical protein